MPNEADIIKQTSREAAKLSSSSPTIAAPKTPSAPTAPSAPSAPSASSTASIATLSAALSSKTYRPNKLLPEPVTAVGLEEAKHSTNWWKRNAAVTIIIELTFSEQFSKDYIRFGKFGMEMENFPSEEPKLKQLYLDYRIDE